MKDAPLAARACHPLLSAAVMLAQAPLRRGRQGQGVWDTAAQAAGEPVGKPLSTGAVLPWALEQARDSCAGTAGELVATP